MTMTKQNWLNRGMAVLLAVMMLLSMVPMTAFAADTSDNLEGYVDFIIKSASTSDGSALTMDSDVELSGGRIIKENDSFYLAIDFNYETKTYKADGTVQRTAVEIQSYLKASTDESAEVDLLGSKEFLSEVLYEELSGNRKKTGNIYTAKIPLSVTNVSEIKGTEVKIMYQYKTTSATQEAVVVLGEVTEKQSSPVVTVTLNDGTYSTAWDGKISAAYGSNSTGRKFGFTASKNYSVSQGAIKWYYTFGNEEITTENASTQYAKVTSGGATVAPDDEVNPQAHTAVLRVRGYVVATNTWLDEATLSVNVSKSSSFSAVYDNNNIIGVFVGYNGLPYDTQLKTEYITDEGLLKEYGNQLKTSAEKDFGTFYAFTLDVSDAEGNKVKIQNSTGSWGSGFYGDSSVYDDSVIYQTTAPRQLYFNVDKNNGYWPTNTQVYYVDDNGALVALPMYKTVLDVYTYTLTSWDWEGDPSGTYVVMQKPLADATTDSAAGDYRVPAIVVNPSTDVYGNAIEQWFSTPSEWNDYVGNSNLLHVNVAEDGTKTMYLYLEDNNGDYITSVKYNNQICTVIECYNVDNATYPKVVAIQLTDTDKNKAYVDIQVNDGNGWQDACLAIQHSGIYAYDPLAVSAPVISTETGAVNYVNDAQANISITATAVDGKIYYTTDGSEPTVENGTFYNGSFALSTENKDGQTFEIKAIAVKEGFANSAVSSLSVTFKKEGESAETVATPSITARYDFVKEGNGKTADTGYYVVSFETETDGAVIYYTLDGSVPTANSLKYEGSAISVPAMTNGKATVIRAIALKDGYNDSELAEREIEFSTEWWDSLEEGDSHEIPAELINLGVYLNKGIKTQSMGAGALTGIAKVYVENGKVYLDVPLQPINVSGIPGNLIDMWYYDGNDNNDGLTYARFFGNNSQEGAIKAAYTYNDDGTVGSVTIPLFGDCEKVFVGLETNVTIMGKKGAIIWLDYSDVIESVTGKTVEKKEQAKMPTISYQYSEADDTFEITLSTDEESATLKYSVNGIEGEYTWGDYTGPFTVSGKDATVVDGATNVAAYAVVDGKDDSGIAAEKLIFAAFGEDSERLEDGVYKVNVEMMNASNPSEYSMGNNAINHIAKLEVIDGEYYITLDFKGITIENRFGYLMDLYYYLDGYTYGTYGGVSGKTAAAEVLSTQKDSDGNDVIDQYNDANNLYPDLVKIKIVDQAIDDENGFVPLHVFVPIMEAIAEGNGDQDVLMKIDWSTLKKTTADDEDFQPDAPVEQSPAVDYTDADTDVKVNADKGVFEADTVIDVTEITSGDDYNKAAESLSDVGKKFKLYNIAFADGEGNAVAPNGTVRLSFPIASDYDADNLFVYRINADGTKTRVNGTVADGYFTVVTRNAGTYALVEAGTADTDNGNDDQGGTTPGGNDDQGGTTPGGNDNQGGTTPGGNDNQGDENGNGGNNVNTDVNSPQTGDTSNMGLWFALMIASLGAMLVTLKLGFKRKSVTGE